jgi:TRAP-type C4-dicarboxylate transport system permease large subunit
MLTMSGITVKVAGAVTESGLPEIGIAVLIMLILLVLGCVLDSNSILLITVPLILPISQVFGWNQIWMGILIIVIVECGILTPPFGLAVFAMHSTLNRFTKVPVEAIFRGALPYVGLMLILVVIMYIFPVIVTWLPGYVI